ncbi:MAG TPA: AmmeMemoRadiSam system protein B [Kiritimatiellia bacterium]|nr:AmmeMemoRadiSam system protein B [Kiritimatiellia bacterium]HSA19682.1 AmmeMemoRadiSam system protein B [Kiritimatiellia bacterium]
MELTMSAAGIRRPAVAGMFYPSAPAELRAMISGWLKAGESRGPVPKAIIAPHAGYIYSGPIAATAYARIQPARGRIRRVVLAGPSHRVAFRGLALSGARAFATPLGDVPVDPAAAAQLRALRQVRVIDPAHALEHSLEVQLPFLQMVLDDFQLVPIAVGDAEPEEVAEALDALWGGPETLIVVSSDLSHYHPYKEARRMDEAASRAIEQLHPEELDPEQACGRLPIAGLLLAAQRHGLKGQTIDLRSSGDTAGPRDEVVGYGAYVFTEP